MLVHGFMGSPEDFSPIAERLSQHYPCIAPCLKGHVPAKPSLAEASLAKASSRSLHSTDIEAYASGRALPYALPAQAQAIEEALAEAQIDAVHGIGYSLGGRVLLEWAFSPLYRTLKSTNPRLRSLCLTAAHVGLPTSSATRQQRFMQDVHIAQRLEAIAHSRTPAKSWEAFLDFWYGLDLFGSLRQHSCYQELKSRRCDHDPMELAAVVLQASNALQRDDRKNLMKLARSMPCLYIAGAQDTKYAHLATELARHNIPAVLMPAIAHAIPVENSTGYGELLMQFLAGLRE